MTPLFLGHCLPSLQELSLPATVVMQRLWGMYEDTVTEENVLNIYRRPN